MLGLFPRQYFSDSVGGGDYENEYYIKSAIQHQHRICAKHNSEYSKKLQ